MGIIVNQSVKGAIYTYIGVVLGFVIQGILFPRIYSTDQIGLTKIIVAYAALVTQFATLGFSGITIRLFPFFKDSKSHHHGYLSLALLTGLAGFLISLVLFLIFKTWFVEYTNENSALLVEYLNYLIVLIFFQIFFTLFDGYYTALLNSIHGTFLREIFQRILIIIGIGLFYFDLINFHQFIIVYIASMAAPTFFILFTLIKEGQFSLKTDFAFLQKPLLNSMGLMALFSILNGFTTNIILTVDTIMITGMIGLSATGIYGSCMIFGMMVSLPSRSILKITNIVSARAWKENNMTAIRNIYEKSCTTLFIIGLLMFLGLWVNIDNVFKILGPNFISGKWVIFFIGLGSLIDMTTGANSSILGSSPRYKVQSFFLIVLVILLIMTNLLLIPIYGITGAAIGGAVSLSILNLLRFLYLWYKFNLQPFNLKFILVAAIGISAYLISSLLPILPNFITDIIVRSSILTVLFCLPVYLLKLSPDINDKADEMLRILRLKSK
ncbi:MAG TPA: polysaccharide biosynthesis C-terminal domain-containing protein [Prolixibacteraceae bacterium]|nr:polysaccharide biosynthesis C-terminal domain-containing protein [Prolixibacteraceae bacterium]